MIEINRLSYDIYKSFPQIDSFPVYSNPNPKTAVLIRLFTMANHPPVSLKYVIMALWSMRSHMLNSDMRDYKPTIVFHIEDVLYYEYAKPIFETAGVPNEYIIVFSRDLVPTTLHDNEDFLLTGDNVLHKAAAPFIDPQLEKFERVIVLDSDSFSLANERSGLVSLMDVSLNKMPPDQLCLLRGWTKWKPVRDEYQNWYDHGGVGKDGWHKAAARYCDTTSETIERIMYPIDPEKTPRPFHNGAYINMPIRLLQDNPEFRQFIKEVSGTMGNEEIALAVWAMRHYLRTGEHFPESNLQDHVFEHHEFGLEWNLDNAWQGMHNGTPHLVHLYSFNQICDYVYDWARAVHASTSEAQVFGDTVVNNVRRLKSSS